MPSATPSYVGRRSAWRMPRGHPPLDKPPHRQETAAMGRRETRSLRPDKNPGTPNRKAHLMIITVHGAKGGQGTTTVAAALALITARIGTRTLLVDTAGDLPAILATTNPTGPGLTDYLHPDRRGLAVEHIAQTITENLDLIAVGTGPTPAFDTSTYGLLTGGCDLYDVVIVDTATHAPAWNRLADRSILVTRPCYLALARAVHADRPTDVVVITEPGRALTTTDIEAALGISVTTVIALDPAVARCIDAGLLNTRLPRTLERAARHLIASEVAR